MKDFVKQQIPEMLAIICLVVGLGMFIYSDDVRYLLFGLLALTIYLIHRNNVQNDQLFLLNYELINLKFKLNLITARVEATEDVLKELIRDNDTHTS